MRMSRIPCYVQRYVKTFLKRRCVLLVAVLSCTFLIVRTFVLSDTFHYSSSNTSNWISRKMFNNINFLPFFSFWDNPGVCSPKTNVSFIKTHKTGSSSVQNIFMRYAFKHNRTLMIPAAGNYFGHPPMFHADMVPKLKDGFHYELLCHHLQMNMSEILKVMPPNTIHVTLIREPVKLFESMYSYYDLYKYYKMDITQFAKTPFNKNIHDHRVFNRFGRNQILFDLGMNAMDFENDTSINDYINTLDEQFDLVMINEYMPESLILLKHLLCWSLDDIVVFHHNTRLADAKTVLEKSIKDKLRELNRADIILYEYFLSKLKSKIEDFGIAEMVKEVALLQERIEEWYSYCVDSLKLGKYLKRKFQPYHPHTYGFKLRNDNLTCETLAISELGFTDEIRENQKPLYKNTII